MGEVLRQCLHKKNNGPKERKTGLSVPLWNYDFTMMALW